MAITSTDVGTVSYNGTDLILEHNDTISVDMWNRSAESSVSTYYLPAVAIALSSSVEFDYDNPVYLYGCIPPSNPASGSGNQEYFTCYYEYAWELVSGPGYGYVAFNEGSVFGSWTNIDLQILGSSGSTGSASGTFTSGTSQYYDSVLGSATALFMQVKLYSQNTAPRSIYKISSFNAYYKKHI